MYICVKSNTYIPVPEDFAEGLDIYTGFNAACGKCMSQGVVVHRGNSAIIKNLMVAVLKCTRLNEFACPSQKKAFTG